jgi:cell division protein FtsZ
MSRRHRDSRKQGIPPITVVGVGGGGCNAVNRMISDDIRGVEFVAVNTDNQQLVSSQAETVIRIADAESDGLGVGGDPERGARAAENSRDEIRNLFTDVDMAFITAGMGGGTGTGAAPIVAEMARQAGALTIAVVTRPFEFEGVPRSDAAQDGIDRLNDVADTVIVIPNQRLIDKNDRSLTVTQAFHRADDVLRQAVRGISDVLTVPGEINLDFNDVKKVMGGGGHALMALGHGSGDNRALDAVEEAIHSPLLEDSIHGATRVLYNATSAGDLGMLELSQIADFVREKVHPNAEIIMGTVVDESLDGDIQMTLIATGFVEAQRSAPARSAPSFATPAPQPGPAFPETAPKPPSPSRTEILESLTFKPVQPRSPEELATPAFLHNRQSVASSNGGSSRSSGRRWDPNAVFGHD